MTAPDLLLRGARTYDAGAPLDVRLSGGLIAAVAPSGTLDAGGAETLELDERYIGPGLWDAHVHFTQWVIQQRRVDLAGTRSASDAVAVVRASGLPNRTSSMFTELEGEWDEVMDVVKRATEAVAPFGTRVSLVLKADIRPGHVGEIDGKVERLERAIGARED